MLIMKEIKAIIRPARLHKIRDAFRGLPGFPGMSISNIEGCSGHSGLEQHDSVSDELTEFTSKVRLEIIAPDEMVAKIVQVVHMHAHSGKTGDGLLWVTEIQMFQKLCLPPLVEKT